MALPSAVPYRPERTGLMARRFALNDGRSYRTHRVVGLNQPLQHAVERLHKHGIVLSLLDCAGQDQAEMLIGPNRCSLVGNLKEQADFVVTNAQCKFTSGHVFTDRIPDLVTNHVLHVLNDSHLKAVDQLAQALTQLIRASFNDPLGLAIVAPGLAAIMPAPDLCAILASCWNTAVVNPRYRLGFAVLLDRHSVPHALAVTVPQTKPMINWGLSRGEDCLSVLLSCHYY